MNPQSRETRIPKSTASTKEGQEKWESLDEILELTRATERDVDEFSTQQLDLVLGDMRVVLAFKKKHDFAGHACTKTDYGVNTQGRIFKIAEMEVIMLRLEQRLATMRAAERRKKREGRTLYRCWRRMRTIGRKSCSFWRETGKRAKTLQTGMGKEEPTKRNQSLSPIDTR